MYPKEYVDYLVHFHGDRDYFECHEILEDYWKQTDSGNKESIWVGLILIAVSAYHHRRRNFSGAKRTLEKAIKACELGRASLSKLGLDEATLLALLHERQVMIDMKQLYTSFSLPIHDSALLNECLKTCMQYGLKWNTESDLSNDLIIHRHTLRDRSGVIAERNRRLQSKKATDC
ncbi:DUF309 domain-containing protein [Bacillus rubiinfantis]|uniref:DUF309 domain-containing protein n=1 Tax=Bacillus rubiinfantis TaxID=1499680 RepID=UPI0005A7396B|nr:DUF309 domain-containing protein [Bacillus rubiinfantis]